jgi:hypothetical protein
VEKVAVKTTYIFEAVDNISETVLKIKKSLDNLKTASEEASGATSQSLENVSQSALDSAENLKSVASETLGNLSNFQKSTSETLESVAESIGVLDTSISSIEVSETKLETSTNLLKTAYDSATRSTNKLGISAFKNSAILSHEIDKVGIASQQGKYSLDRFAQSIKKVGTYTIKFAAKGARGGVGGMMSGGIKGAMLGLTSVLGPLAIAFTSITAALAMFGIAIGSAKERTEKYNGYLEKLENGEALSAFESREKERYERDLPVLEQLTVIGNILSDWWATFNDVSAALFQDTEEMAKFYEGFRDAIITLLSFIAGTLIFVRSLLTDIIATLTFLFDSLKLVVVTNISLILDALAMILRVLSLGLGNGLADKVSEMSASLKSMVNGPREILDSFVNDIRNPLADGSRAFADMSKALGSIQLSDKKALSGQKSVEAISKEVKGVGKAINGQTKASESFTKKVSESFSGFVDLARDALFTGDLVGGTSFAGIFGSSGNAGNKEEESDHAQPGVGSGFPSSLMGGIGSPSLTNSRNADQIGSGSQMGNADSGSTEIHNDVKIELNVDTLSEDQLSKLGELIIKALTDAVSKSSGSAKELGI